MNRGPGTGTVHSSHGRQVKAIDASSVLGCSRVLEVLCRSPAADARAVPVDVVMVRNSSLAGLGFGVETSKKLRSRLNCSPAALLKATGRKTGKKGKGGRD